MKQHNQIGKYTKKEEVLNAKAGRTFVTPKNREYTFDYRREGSKYIFILGYLGKRMQVRESDFNRQNTDDLLSLMEQ